MNSGFSVKLQLRLGGAPVAPQLAPLPSHRRHRHGMCLRKIVCCDKEPSSSDRKFNLTGLRRSLLNNKWKLNEIDTGAMQDSLSNWLSRTQSFLSDVTSPLVKTVNERRPIIQDSEGDMDEVFLAGQTINSRTPNGELSMATIFCIEQFSRMNGLTGEKMQKIFKTLVPNSVYNNARNLVEYCCFRFLSRESSEIHPSLKDPAFRRLMFVTMLAWERPYCDGKDSQAKAADKYSLKRRLVGEAAFIRIAPAVSGVADWSTAHNLFKALARDEEGISYMVWSVYISELFKIHEDRKSYRSLRSSLPAREKILCLSSSRKPPVLKWEKNKVWPGKLTLTDGALYFEGIHLKGQKDVMRLDLTKKGIIVTKTRVGPLGSGLFDSAVSISSSLESEPWVLEFVDLGGDMRRDVWHAFINEVVDLHKFIHEFGPQDGDQSLFYVHGAQKGKAKAISFSIGAIARLQALQHMRRLLDEPTKIVPFSYLRSVSHGDVVCQTLAVNFWAGPLITDSKKDVPSRHMTPISVYESSNHVFDIDGSVYLQKWMRSRSWASSASAAFWKNIPARSGVVLSKNLIVAGTSLVEKAAMTCREKHKVAEKTQATITAAMIEGIPSNIDLFKQSAYSSAIFSGSLTVILLILLAHDLNMHEQELILPVTIFAKSVDRLRRWEEPLVTTSFIVVLYTIIYRNMLSYLFPMTLMMLAAGMLLLKGLKEQGRLGRYFGKVTIRDQPQSNTIQKIMALKQAMREVEKYLQDLNISLLKFRSIILAGQPQITTEVALVLLLSATVLLLVPFKYILSFLILDFFTRELPFRQNMVLKFRQLLKERWNSIPAAPVVVLPCKVDEPETSNKNKSSQNRRALKDINSSHDF